MEKKITPDWLRLEEVTKAVGMSVNKFALHIGLKRSENLYQIKKGNHGISKELATVINRHFPQFSIGWLLTGEHAPGEEKDKPTEAIKAIPVYRKLIGGLANSPTDQVAYLGESLANGAVAGIINADESLSPKIPVGALVLLRPETGPIFPGKLYYIETGNFHLIRIIRLTDNPEEYRLVPIDRVNYDDVVLSVKKIKKILTVEKTINEL